MSSLRPRKRRRAQAFPDKGNDNDEVLATGQNGNDGSAPHESDRKEVSNDPDQLEKEREVWDAFREEYFEAVEQMPLTLHRQFTLMRELDQQTHGYTADLLPTLHKYISKRRALAPLPSPPPQPEMSDELLEGADNSTRPRAQDEDPPPKEERPPTPPTGFLSKLPNGTPPSQPPLDSPAKAGPSTPLRRLQAECLSTPRTPTPMGIPPERVKAPQTTREMLSHIAWLSEELLRASEEKVNLAQAAYDSVNRHIRLLEQAIKEQEASISLGIRPGTHPAPILLPDLIVPRWGRPSRTTLSPIPNFAVEGNGGGSGDGNETGKIETEGGQGLGLVSRRGPGRPRIHSLRGRGVKGQGPRRGGNQAEQEESEDVPDKGRLPGRVRSSNLKITLPPVPPQPDMTIDPAEPRYCYCNQVSFGEMIACDDANCQLEWFHLGCAGLTEPPKPSKKWYCRECTAARSRKRR